MKWLLGNNGLLWFLNASYNYVHPVGFKKHIEFFIELPFAAYRYMRLRASQ